MKGFWFGGGKRNDFKKKKKGRRGKSTGFQQRKEKGKVFEEAKKDQRHCRNSRKTTAVGDMCNGFCTGQRVVSTQKENVERRFLRCKLAPKSG